MADLSDLLQNVLDWTQYQASAYTVLVKDGPMEASEVALKADIPDARVYGVLSALEKNGSVKKQGKRPAIYDAQHPRKVIEQKQEEFESKSEEAKSKLEEAFEVERDVPYSSTDRAWVMASAHGTVNEIRNAWEDAEEEVLFIDSDLRWLSAKDARDLGELVDQEIDVKAVGRPSTPEKLEDLVVNGVDARSFDEVERSYYVIDQQTVILRVGRGSTGIVFNDQSMASIFIEAFEQVYMQASEVPNIAS